MRNPRMMSFLMVTLFFVAGSVGAEPMSTAFTYQGLLKSNGELVNDTIEMNVTVWDGPGTGNPPMGATRVAPVIEYDDVLVEDGLFMVTVDFGAEVFDGEARWLQISVRGSEDSQFTVMGPRQPLTATPYALQTRGLFVDEDGKVGIGTTSPEAALEIEDDGNEGLRVTSTNTSFGYGVTSVVAGGGDSTAVFGRATSSIGNLNRGVWGIIDGISGYGVQGESLSTSGDGTGVFGRTLTSGGFGVYGVSEQSATGGTGVQGVSHGGGVGVWGLSTATTGSGIAVGGQSFANNGYGGYFVGQTWGVYGETSSSDSGSGVQGQATNSNGLVTRGVYGRNNSADGYGVEGINSSGTGGIGVRGSSNSINGSGVLGSSTNGTGVRGVANGATGVGVFGNAIHPDGTAGYFSGRVHITGNLGVGMLPHASYRLALPNTSNSTGRGVANRWDTYSSGQWKENVRPIGGALATVMALRGVRFDWAQDNGESDDIGFIAEEVGEVLPEIVTLAADGKSAESMDYARLTPLLVEAMKEQQEEIAELEARLERLEQALGEVAANLP